MKVWGGDFSESGLDFLGRITKMGLSIYSVECAVASSLSIFRSLIQNGYCCTYPLDIMVHMLVEEMWISSGKLPEIAKLAPKGKHNGGKRCIYFATKKTYIYIYTYLRLVKVHNLIRKELFVLGTMTIIEYYFIFYLFLVT